jgi:hypothetical protein
MGAVIAVPVADRQQRRFAVALTGSSLYVS